MILLAMALLLGQQTPRVPGMCADPAAEHVGQAGCYLSAELTIDAGADPVFWHVVAFADADEARAEAARHRWATVVSAHDKHWLYVIGAEDEVVNAASPVKVIGPLRRPASGPVVVRFLELIFPPGMRTRAHAHPGPEAFYVVEGEQCMDLPTAQVRIAAGESYILEGGPHLQAAPTGRRNLVAVVVPATETWMSMTPEWTPTAYCDR